MIDPKHHVAMVKIKLAVFTFLKHTAGDADCWDSLICLHIIVCELPVSSNRDATNLEYCYNSSDQASLPWKGLHIVKFSLRCNSTMISLGF